MLRFLLDEHLRGPGFSESAGRALHAYSLGSIDRVVPLGNHSGFSGVYLWQLHTASGCLCLRAWPACFAPARLNYVHDWVRTAEQAGLGFVPRVLSTRNGAGFVEQAGRLWEVTTWMPGCADFHAQPTRKRLSAAVTALAKIHIAWTPRDVRRDVRRDVCPAVLRRLRVIDDWRQNLRAGWRPQFQPASLDALERWAERAWRLVCARIDDAVLRLMPWSSVSLPLQPCLCDVWHDHVLFTGDRVTGIIDYGSMKTDHVAVDLARLIGSLAGNDARRREVAFNAYRRVRPLSDQEIELVHVLDWTGTLLGAANWLKWIYREQREFENRELVARRLGQLVSRMEGW